MRGEVWRGPFAQLCKMSVRCPGNSPVVPVYLFDSIRSPESAGTSLALAPLGVGVGVRRVPDLATLNKDHVKYAIEVDE